MKEKAIIKEIKKFVTGKTSINTFYDIYLSNSSFQLFCEKFNNVDFKNKYEYSFNEFLRKCNWSYRSDQVVIFMLFSLFLNQLNIKYKPTKLYYDRYDLVGPLLPRYLSSNAINYMERYVLPLISKNITEDKYYQKVQKQAKLLFKYTNTPPSFAQQGYWPLDDFGKPLKFVEQKTFGEKVVFEFFNEATNETVKYEELF